MNEIFSSDPLGLGNLDLSSVPIPLPTTLPAKPLLERIPNCPQEYILRLDNSSLEKLDGCARAAEYYLVSRRQGLASAALAFGGALHLALEMRYKGHDHSACVSAALERYSSVTLRPDEWRTPEFLAFTLNYYDRCYNFVDFTPLKDTSNSPLVEIPFSLPLGTFDLNCTLAYTEDELLRNGESNRLFVKTLHVYWSGKIDLAIASPDGPCVVDHKTSSIDAPSFYDQFFLSQPVHGYAWALERHIGEPVRQFMLNAIIIRKPTRTGTSNLCLRKPYPIHAENILEFEHDVKTKIETFVHHLRVGYFPKSPFHCQNKFGSCPYFSVCTVSADARDAFLNSDLYENVTWSPLTDGA